MAAGCCSGTIPELTTDGRISWPPSWTVGTPSRKLNISSSLVWVCMFGPLVSGGNLTSPIASRRSQLRGAIEATDLQWRLDLVKALEDLACEAP